MSKITENTRNEVKDVICNFFAEECEIDLSKINEDTNVIKDLESEKI